MYSLEYGNVLQVERPIVIKIVWLRQQQNTGRCQNKFVGSCRYSSGVKCSVSFYPSRECANDDKYITRKWTNVINVKTLNNVGTLVEVVKEWGWVGNYSGRSFCQSGQFLMKYFTCWRMESRFIFLLQESTYWSTNNWVSDFTIVVRTDHNSRLFCYCEFFNNWCWDIYLRSDPWRCLKHVIFT